MLTFMYDIELKIKQTVGYKKFYKLAKIDYLDTVLLKISPVSLEFDLKE